MSNLMIVLISIVLISILAGASIFLGGDAYTSQSVEAEAAKMRNERNQIIAAIEIYKSDGNTLGNLFKFTSLTENGYLKKVPDGWIAQDGYAYRPFDESDPGAMNICYTANKQDGYTYTQDDTDVEAVPNSSTKAVPYCSKEGIPSTLPCCVNTESE